MFFKKYVKNPKTFEKIEEFEKKYKGFFKKVGDFLRSIPGVKWIIVILHWAKPKSKDFFWWILDIMINGLLIWLAIINVVQMNPLWVFKIFQWGLRLYILNYYIKIGWRHYVRYKVEGERYVKTLPKV